MTVDANGSKASKSTSRVADLGREHRPDPRLARAPKSAARSITASARPRPATHRPATSTERNAHGLADQRARPLFGGPPTRSSTGDLHCRGPAVSAPRSRARDGDRRAYGLDIKDLGRVGAGRLSLSGHSGSTLALKATPACRGRLDVLARPRLSGVATAGDDRRNAEQSDRRMEVRSQRMVAPQIRNAGLPALNVAAPPLGVGRTFDRRDDQCRDRTLRHRSAPSAARGAGREDRWRPRRPLRQFHAFPFRVTPWSLWSRLARGRSRAHSTRTIRLQRGEFAKRPDRLSLPA